MMENWKMYKCVESKQHIAEQLSNNGQKTSIAISPKRTYIWPVGTYKDAQHC